MLLLAAIFGLGFLILVHEWGHYIVARWCGMHVERFSIGFGPALLKWTNRHGTVFQLAPIPFGGFAQIKGMNPLEEVDPDDKTAYANHPTWKRIAAIVAGPAANYVAAMLLAVFVFYSVGAPSDIIKVAAVAPGYDANGKLLPGDIIRAIDGEPLKKDEPLLARIGRAPSNDVRVTVTRGGQDQDVTVRRQLDYMAPFHISYRLGIALDNRVPVSLGHAVGRALTYPYFESRRIIDGFGKIIRREEKADVGGPVRIVEEFHRAAQISITALISLVMMLSVYVGLFNLLPFPALDGGRLVFLGYELLTRRRANPRVEANIHMIGIAILVPLMMLVLFKDCSRLL